MWGVVHESTPISTKRAGNGRRLIARHRIPPPVPGARFSKSSVRSGRAAEVVARGDGTTAGIIARAGGLVKGEFGHLRLVFCGLAFEVGWARCEGRRRGGTEKKERPPIAPVDTDSRWAGEEAEKSGRGGQMDGQVQAAIWADE